MKKIILPVVLLAGFFTHAQSPLTGTKLILTNSPTTPASYADSNARSIATNVISAGSVTNATTGSRVFTFFDMPQSNFDAAPTVLFNIDNRNYNTRLRFSAVQGGSSVFYLFDKNQAQNFTVADDGSNNISLTMPKANSRVMIGTNSFTDGTDVYSLSVNGNVRADRVKVYTTWADFVFEKDYKLPTLEEVEKHILEKGHLLDIPSAKEVEANGIDLGDMNKKLLQKIEELTLYTIELNKQVQELKEQINTK